MQRSLLKKSFATLVLFPTVIFAHGATTKSTGLREVKISSNSWVTCHAIGKGGIHLKIDFFENDLKWQMMDVENLDADKSADFEHRFLASQGFEECSFYQDLNETMYIDCDNAKNRDHVMWTRHAYTEKMHSTRVSSPGSDSAELVSNETVFLKYTTQKSIYDSNYTYEQWAIEKCQVVEKKFDSGLNPALLR